jgi:hypothetical protein
MRLAEKLNWKGLTGGVNKQPPVDKLKAGPESLQAIFYIIAHRR